MWCGREWCFSLMPLNHNSICQIRFFCYLQLRHAFPAQFGTFALVVRVRDLKALLRDDDLPNTLSIIYKQLFTDTSRVMVSCKNAWLVDFPQMDGDDWDASFTRLMSARDHLIQYKILHRAYLTPAPVWPSSFPLCPLPAGAVLPHKLTFFIYFGTAWSSNNGWLLRVQAVIATHLQLRMLHISYFSCFLLCQKNNNFIMEKNCGSVNICL